MTMVEVILSGRLVCCCRVKNPDAWQACQVVKKLYAHLMFAGMLEVRAILPN